MHRKIIYDKDPRNAFTTFLKGSTRPAPPPSFEEILPGNEYIDTSISRQVIRQELIKALFDQCMRDLAGSCALKETKHDPHQLFEPSIALAILVDEHLDMPDENETRSLNKIRKFYGGSPITRFDLNELSSIISRTIEGYLSNLAKRSEEANIQINISKKGRFTPKVSLDLIDRLQLDAYDARPVLDLLFDELYQFACQIPRRRSWGEITAEGSDILLEIKDEALAFPDFGSLDEEGWINL